MEKMSVELLDFALWKSGMFACHERLKTRCARKDNKMQGRNGVI